MPEGSDGDSTLPWRELAVVLALAVGAGAAVKVASVWTGDGTALMRDVGLLVLLAVLATAGGRRRFSPLERWQTQHLPAYGAWAAVVIVVFPPVFGF